MESNKEINKFKKQKKFIGKKIAYINKYKNNLCFIYTANLSNIALTAIEKIKILESSHINNDMNKIYNDLDKFLSDSLVPLDNAYQLIKDKYSQHPFTSRFFPSNISFSEKDKKIFLKFLDEYLSIEHKVWDYSLNKSTGESTKHTDFVKTTSPQGSNNVPRPTRSKDDNSVPNPNNSHNDMEK